MAEKKDFSYYLDFSYYIYDGEKESIFVQGWTASDKYKDISVEIFDRRGERIEASVKKRSEDPIRMSLKEENREKKYINAFLISFSPEHIFGEKDGFIVYAVLPEKRIPMGRYKASAIKRQYEKRKMKLNIEGWKKGEKETVIRGWGYHMYLPTEIRVLSKEGKIIPAEISRLRRVDLERAFFLPNKNKDNYGFIIKIDNSSIDPLSSKKLTVELLSGEEKQKKSVDIYKEQRVTLYEPLWKKALSINKWKRAFYILKNEGMGKVIRKIRYPGGEEDERYERWFASHRVTTSELKSQREHVFSLNPKYSIIIPLYNTRLEFLKALMDSVMSQSYENFELCLADGSTVDSVGEFINNNYKDERIVYKRLKKNEGIAGNTNAALSMATGDFILLCDHDDILEPDALYEITMLYNENPDLTIIYTDEDITDKSGGKFVSPRFKPEYNHDLLCSINYICHIFVVKKDIIDEVGGFRSDYDGAQDWDLILRCCERSKSIGHIPKILYHWRAHEESTAGNIDSKEYAIEAGRRAVSDHMKRIGQDAELIYTDVFVMFRPRLIPKTRPLISIIIPNKDEKETLRTCIESIEKKTNYDSFEIIIVENNSTTEEIFEYYRELEREYKNITVVNYEGSFNYSSINNFGATFAKGEYLLLLNNDTEVISPDYLSDMLGYCERKSTGIVGAKLYYPDDTVQHCGAVIGLGGFAGHVMSLSNREDAGYLGRLKAPQELSAVTAACMMIKRKVFEEVGGLDEDFTVALNDMDLCLKVRKAGYLVVLDPGVELYHYESKSRGFEETTEKHMRFKKEVKRFRDKWKEEIDRGDPYYSPNLTLMYGDFRVRSEGEFFDIVQEIEEDDAEINPQFLT